MPQIPLGNFSLNGDISMMPFNVPSYQAAMWRDWRVTSIDHLKGAQAYIESDQSFGMPTTVIRMEKDKLHFTVIDLDPNDDNAPNPMSRTIRFHDLGKDTMAAYLMTRFVDNGDFEARDNLRREQHLKMVATLQEKLKEAGLNFGNQDRATAGLQDLTAYWFDILDAKGDLNPRPERRTKQFTDKPAI